MSRSRSKYPDALRQFVFSQYDKGVRAGKILQAVHERWPEYSGMSINSLGMMVGARARMVKGRGGKALSLKDDRSLVRAPITLAGPKWSRGAP